MKRTQKQIMKHNYQQAEIMKYLACLNQEQYQELQTKLDEIDKIEDAKEKQNKEDGLKLWLVSKYITASNACITCVKYETCKRNKTKVKNCKLWEGAE